MSTIELEIEGRDFISRRLILQSNPTNPRWMTAILNTEGVFHLLILAINLAMDGPQRLTGRRWHHWGTSPELLLSRYDG
jgi:hypothetical protein